MKKNYRKLTGTMMLLLLVITITMTGCGKVPKLKNGQDAVVTLNGNNISVDTLYNEMKERYALSILLDLTDTEILNQKYKDTEEIKTDIQEEVDLWVLQYGQGDESKLLQQIGMNSIDEFRDYIKLLYKRNLAIEDYAKSIVKDDEINKLYEEKIFGDINAKHILIAPEVTSSMTDAEKIAAEDEALKKANELITKLKNGEDFSNLAREYSDDESNASDGGTLTNIVHGSMVEEFEEAVKNLEIGKYTETPVKTTYGYHIIYKESQKEKPELKTVKEDIIEEIAREKLKDKTLQITALEELRKEYKVDIQDDSLKTQYENYLQYSKEEAKK